VIIHSANELIAFTSGLAQSNEWPLRIEVKKASGRSIPMNSTFHMWMNELSVFLISKGRKDASPKFCKDLMKYTFLGCEDVEMTNAVTGSKVLMMELRHTSKLDEGEFLHSMEQVNQWCADKGLLLTVPIKSEYRELIERQNN